MPRAFLFVLDSFGIGGAPDAKKFKDEGSNTLGHIASFCNQGKADGSNGNTRSGRLKLPHLEAFGLGLCAKAACGALPEGFSQTPKLVGAYAHASEISKGKDTPSGHWEIAGVPVLSEWGYFPDIEPCFPRSLTDEIIKKAKLPGILGNKHGSGTDIIAELGLEHIRSGKPICYTSADSVFQIAAHETHFGLERLYELCEIVFELTAPMNIGRVIARPFVGESVESFERTGNRRDFSVEPPAMTLLEQVSNLDREMIAIGKIADIYAHKGPTKVVKANGNEALAKATIDEMDGLADGGLLMTNFVDFDQLFGHRRDVAGYADALEKFDRLIPKFIAKMRKDDILILTADHGCDPTWRGTDHTREQVPVLIYGQSIKPVNAGQRNTFSDIGATIGEFLELPKNGAGKSFLAEMI